MVGMPGRRGWGGGGVNIPARLFEMLSAEEEHDECRAERRREKTELESVHMG